MRRSPADGAAPRSEVIPVFGDELATVVGGMYPGTGFVPIGAGEEVLARRANPRLTITVRNESSQLAVLDVTEARDEARGGAERIAPPIAVAPNAERQVLVEVPRNRWSLNLRGDLGFFYSDDLARAAKAPGFAMVVTEDRMLTMVEGE